MTKLAIGILSLALLAGGALAAGTFDDGPEVPTTRIGTSGGDVPGTTGTTGTTVETTATTGETTTSTVEDVSGPCDEPEHANDRRCTGGAAGDDRSGPGSGADDNDDDSSGPGSGADGDRSGSNSGSG